MSSSVPLHAGVRFTLAAAAAAVALPAFAQEQGAAGGSQPVETVEEIVVTGSRIQRTNLDAPTPTVVLDQGALQQQGYNNFADVATQLPQFAASFGASRTQSTFSGAATSGLNLANLRNLGAGRTLVLINGRRTAAGTTTGTSVDFNTLPTANIDRIEVLTGGASAIYGSDAVAGVINIITRKDFEGVEFGVNYAVTEEGDNESPGAHVMMGSPFADGRGRGLLTIQYDEQGLVRCADRFLCAEDFAWTNPAVGPIRGPAAYSGVPPQGRFFIGNTSYTSVNGSFANATGQPIPFVVSQHGYNRNPRRTLAIPTNRLMIAGDVEFELAPGVSAFAEVNYGQSETKAPFEGAPFSSDTNVFGGGPGVPGLQPTIPVNNPFIPAVLRPAITAAGASLATSGIQWSQRFDQLGLRGAENTRESIRAVAGFRGDLPVPESFGTDWTWEIHHVYGRTTLDSLTTGLVGTDRLYYALRVEPDPANAGQFRCIDPGARASGCVPINPFAGGYTAPQAAWLNVNAGQRGRSLLQDSQAFVTGAPFQLPAGPFRMAVGVDYREFSGFLDYDEQINRGLTTGNQIGDVAEIKTITREAYVEAIAPILRDAPFARSLNVEAAYRRSKSTNTDEYGTWKYGGDWEPVEGLRVRAMRARAVRAPVPGELSGIGQTFGVVNDPCTASRRNANPTRAANCAAAGVPAGYTPPLTVEQGVQGFVGGNPNLQPEQATTLTYGIVFAPGFLPDFSLAIDRFQIRLDEAISTVGRGTKVNACYDQGLFCQDIVRGTDPAVPGANYVLKAVNDQSVNIASYDIRGIDVEARYAFDLGQLAGDRDLGRLSLQAIATFYDEAEYQPLPNGPYTNLLGFAGGTTSDQGFLRRQGNLTLGYSFGNFGASWQARYIGRTDQSPFISADYPEIGSHMYHNLRVSFRPTQKTEIYAGANNLFDKEPPFFVSGASGTQALDTIPAYYDVFGRTYFAGARVGF